VNLAQRLEELNKEFGTNCLISGATFAAAGPSGGSALAMGPRQVRGREEAVEVFAVTGASSQQEGVVGVGFVSRERAVENRPFLSLDQLRFRCQTS
jgi:hypothetical protein